MTGNGSQELGKEPVSDDVFRNAMSNLAAGVSVVTTDGEAGRAGLTATSVTSVTGAPPSLLVCVNRESMLFTKLWENNVFCINVLCEPQQDIANVFAGRTGLDGEDRFSQGQWGSLESGAPYLEGARVAMGCHLTSATEIGTHAVVFGTLTEVRILSSQPPLLYVDRNYHTLALPVEA